MSNEEQKKYELARASTIEGIASGMCETINSRTGEGITAHPNSYGLDIAPNADPADLLKAGDMFARATVMNNYTTAANRFSLGDIINHAVLSSQDDADQVIQDMQLAEKTGLSMRTIYTWSLTAKRIRKGHRHNNLTWTTFVLFASFKGVNPDRDPINHVKFEDGRMRLLDLVATDPDRYGPEFIKEQMKLLQKAGQVVPKKVVTKKELFEYGAKLLCIQALLGPADLSKMGKGQSDVTDAIEELQNELINRNIIDPTNMVWPCLNAELGGGQEDAEESDSDEGGAE